MNINDFNDQLQNRISKFLIEISDLEESRIINVKKDRGAFPRKIEKYTDEHGRVATKLIPYTTNDIFAVYLISDDDPGLAVMEGDSATVNGYYSFKLEFLLYGANASFYAQSFLMNSNSPNVRFWMQSAELSWTERPSVIETLDTVINNEWWIIRKLTLKLNVGITMTFAKGDVIETIDSPNITLLGFEI